MKAIIIKESDLLALTERLNLAKLEFMENIKHKPPQEKQQVEDFYRSVNYHVHGWMKKVSSE